MFDNGPVPGRNDACWCGSGKKYKKCHSAFDERLERLWEEGWEVLPRTLYKTPADIEGIKRSAAINVGVLDYVGEHIAAGMTTNQIDQMIYDYTIEHGGTPADLNYEGYPKSVCTSINDVVCHGIPCDTDVLHEGDIINVDCSTILDGYFSDSSRMFCIGEVDPGHLMSDLRKQDGKISGSGADIQDLQHFALRQKMNDFFSPAFGNAAV